MKKTILFLVGIAIGIVLVYGAYSLEKMPLGSSYENTLTSITHTTTSTTSALPVLVLDSNLGRKYARIENVSDVPVYIYLGDFDSTTAASTTVALQTGVELSTTTVNYYEINRENLYTGQIYATSSAASKVLLISESSY